MLSFIPLYIYILEPSYVSVKTVCNNASFEEYDTAGYYNSCSDTISIVVTNEVYVNQSLFEEYQQTEDYKRILKHEMCHRNQAEEGRLFSCSNPVKLFFNEFECYVKQYF